MDLQSIIGTLKGYLLEVPPLKKLNYNYTDRQAIRQFELWCNKVRSFLELRFGKDSEERASFRGIAAAYVDNPQATYLNVIEALETDLMKIIQRLEMQQELSISTNPPPSPVAVAGLRPAVFIAHGGESSALAKLEEFVTALGCEPIIAEKQPSADRSVNQQVEWCLDRSDCAIVLATAESLKEGKLYSRPNVYIELGRFQERYPGKTIYLLEEGAQFPSNVSEKVWEHFKQNNMERAFLKVVRELQAFGFLHVGKSS